VSGKNLRSNLGGLMIDGTGMDAGNGKGSIMGLYRLGFMMGTESNNALTSSIDSSMSKFIPK